VSAEELVALLAEAGPVAVPPPEPAAPAVVEALPPSAQASAAWLERLRAHVEAELAAGQLKTAEVARHYVRAVERMLAWAGSPSSRAEVAAGAQGWLEEVKAGRTGTGTDKVFGRPAIGRLLTLLEADEAGMTDSSGAPDAQARDVPASSKAKRGRRRAAKATGA
jgi:hypothetical protein